MKPLPLWVRFFLWCIGTSDKELLGRGAPMVRRESLRPSTRGHEIGAPLPALPPPTEIERQLLVLQLRRIDATFALAFGAAVQNPFTGHVERAFDKRWLQ